MKTASRVMYFIARIFLVIAIISIIVGLVFSIIGIFRSEGDARITNISYTIVLGIFLLIEFIVFGITSRALRDLKSARNAKHNHILCLILGIISCDVFFILGGIFGLVA
ncbi:MAG: hypothetical protein IJQ67_05860 [Bacilli bacterium]|nr:hypothetical protein [Bacilli bacterium]